MEALESNEEQGLIKKIKNQERENEIPIKIEQSVNEYEFPLELYPIKLKKGSLQIGSIPQLNEIIKSHFDEKNIEILFGALRTFLQTHKNITHNNSMSKALLTLGPITIRALLIKQLLALGHEKKSVQGSEGDVPKSLHEIIQDKDRYNTLLDAISSASMGFSKPIVNLLENLGFKDTDKRSLRKILNDNSELFRKYASILKLQKSKPRMRKRDVVRNDMEATGDLIHVNKENLMDFMKNMFQLTQSSQLGAMEVESQPTRVPNNQPYKGIGDWGLYGKKAVPSKAKEVEQRQGFDIESDYAAYSNK